jgi:hypothetical protein
MEKQLLQMIRVLNSPAKKTKKKKALKAQLNFFCACTIIKNKNQ